MARNSEKAMTTLARWRAAHLQSSDKSDRRPYLASECDDLGHSEKWRRQIIGEISRKMAQIQNAGLGEFKLRDLNDEINKLLREKGHWEDRIVELGGPDFARIGPKMLDHEGKEVPGNRGYLYFGATKDLPGVRELFEQEPPTQKRKTRAELMKDIDADYYGCRDDDDGVLVPLEATIQKEAIAAKVRTWKARKEAILHGDGQEDADQIKQETEEEDIYKVDDEYSDEDMEGVDDDDNDDDDDDDKTESHIPHFISHVPVPSQKEIEEALLQRKKTELLAKYASEALQAETETTRTLTT